MRARAAALLALALVCGPAPGAQDAPPEAVLWLPDGYRLMSPEERQALTAEEMRELGTRNAEALNAAVAAMRPQERHEIADALSRYLAERDPPDYVKQYVTMAHMQMLASAVQESE